VTYLLYRRIFVSQAIRARAGTVSIAGAFLARCFAHVIVDPNYQMKSESLAVYTAICTVRRICSLNIVLIIFVL
jgi:hypothetical protein